jgi:hypothetical protein
MSIDDELENLIPTSEVGSDTSIKFPTDHEIPAIALNFCDQEISRSAFKEIIHIGVAKLVRPVAWDHEICQFESDRLDHFIGM